MPVAVKGAVALRKALRDFTPDLAKKLPKEMAIALKPVVKTARGYAPSESQILSGWKPRQMSEGRFPTYNASMVKAGIGYKTTPSKPNRRGFRSLARLFNKTAAGAIYETAGRKRPDSRFVQNLNSKYSSVMKGQGKMEGRVLYRAFEEDQGKAQTGVLNAIEKAKINLNKRATVRG
jgi:flagellar hook-basal body complex protein FliE